MKKSNKKKARKLVIKTWFFIGAMLVFSGILLLAGTEDAIKYFNGTSVIYPIIGVAIIFVGGFMCKDALKYEDEF